LHTRFDADQFPPAIFAASKAGLMPPAKASVFRYISLQGNGVADCLRETILEDSLPLTTPRGFNDPFEAKPNIIEDMTNNEVNKLLHDRELVFHYEDEKQSVAKVITRAVKDTREKFRIASFSRRISSQLLWAHYADGYRGMAYHFITSGSPDSVLHKLRPVQYVTQRPIISLSEILEILSSVDQDTENSRRFLLHANFSERFFLHKSAEWSYEQEERIVVRHDSQSTFLDSELVALIVGPLCPAQNLAKIREIVKERSRPLKIIRAKVSSTDYSVEVNWDRPLFP
jgi:hypothetical protein